MQFPSNSFVRVGERWFRVFGHAADGVTVNTYSVTTGKAMAIHADCIDEVSDMARGRKSADAKKTEEAAKATDNLLEAVQFCAPGYVETGETYSTHAMIYGNWITTYNGIVMYGCKVEMPMQAFPHYGRLLSALKAVSGDGVQITQLSPDKLSIKGKGFRTIVPCLTDYTQVSRTPPDTSCGMIDSRMREGFEIMRQIAKKSGETIMQSAVLIRNGDMIACDRQLLGMYWHGIPFPELAVPADFIEAVLRVPKSLVSFGFTEGQSLTFWFADESFIRTQLYSESYPDVSKVIPDDWSGMEPVPAGLFAALKRIQPFVDKTKRMVWTNDGKLTTEDDADEGTAVDCEGMKFTNYGLDVERFLKLENRITKLKYDAQNCIFEGEAFRGLLCNFVTDRKGEPESSYEIATYAELPPNATGSQVAEAFAQLQPGTDPPYTEGYAPQQTPGMYQPPEPVLEADAGDPVDEPQTPAGFAPPPGFGPPR